MTKEELRTRAIERRRTIDEAERIELSRQICNRVAEEPMFLDAGGVHLYSPLAVEVDVRPLLEIAWGLGIETGMMVVDEEGGSRQVEISEETTFAEGPFGLMQPVEDVPFEMSRCDLVIVPAVAVDEQGNRLGYGKGYYDQFLAKNPRPTIATVFDLQVVESVPSDERDITLDLILTESRRIEPA